MHQKKTEYNFERERLMIASLILSYFTQPARVWPSLHSLFFSLSLTFSVCHCLCILWCLSHLSLLAFPWQIGVCSVLGKACMCEPDQSQVQIPRYFTMPAGVWPSLLRSHFFALSVGRVLRLSLFVYLSTPPSHFAFSPSQPTPAQLWSHPLSILLPQTPTLCICRLNTGIGKKGRSFTPYFPVLSVSKYVCLCVQGTGTAFHFL